MKPCAATKPDADIIIVGGGPAGSSCALQLGRQRRRVLLLEKARMPRPKPCAGWVNARAFKEFPDLQKLLKKSSARQPPIETPFTGIVFHSSDFARQGVYNARRTAGYLVQRRFFDAALLKSATALAGVRAEQNARVTAVNIEEQGVTATLDDGRTFAAPLLVGADGANSDVARLCGLRDQWPQSRQLLCLVAELSVDSRIIDRLHGKQRRLHVAMNYQGIPGHGWLFPKRRSINVGVAVRGDHPADLAALYRRWTSGAIAARLAPPELADEEPQQAMTPAGGALDYEGHVGKRLLLIGDAGGFAASATGEGIYPAMLSAAVAAECLDNALKSGKVQDALMEFKFAWRRRFAEYIQMPNANLSFLLPLVYDNAELCRRLGRCYLFGENL